MQVREYAKSNQVEVKDILNFLKEQHQQNAWKTTSVLTEDIIQALDSEFLQSQEEQKALPQAETQTQIEQVQPQESETENQTSTAIQAAESQPTSQPLLSQSDLEAIKVIRETFGEQGVQTFLMKKKQEQIINRATGDALRQHDEQKLYSDIRLRVANELQLRDLIAEQQAFDFQMTQHNQLINQYKESNKKRDEAFDKQLGEYQQKQQETILMIEALGLTM